MLPRVSATVAIPKDDLQIVFDNLRGSGFRLIGPTVNGAAIRLQEIHSIDDLPIGWTDEQQPGRYRLTPNGSRRFFDFASGPEGWRRFLQPPRLTLFEAEAEGRTLSIRDRGPDPTRFAFVGVRSCDLHALAALDRVLMQGAFADQDYAARRASAFLLAVHCAKPSSSCFCRSTETGPQVSSGFDLAATELAELFLLEVGSEAGSQALEGTSWHAATAFEIGSARDVIREAERQITRELRTDHLGSVLFEHLESAHWKEIADRCLGCGNCTMVCPTCFCTTVCDTVGLTCATERVRLWDSCYTTEFSHVHGGNIRPSARARYRQWLTHKFATYREQFGVSGCVGCGRCITWCPVQIDITEELGRFRSTGAAR